jgi:hypothetical protein
MRVTVLGWLLASDICSSDTGRTSNLAYGETACHEPALIPRLTQCIDPTIYNKYTTGLPNSALEEQKLYNCTHAGTLGFHQAHMERNAFDFEMIARCPTQQPHCEGGS